MASLDELKRKYQSVIQMLQSQRIQLANLYVKDGKLFLKGAAPSLEAANAVWNEIKRINPQLDDIIADFPVNASTAPTPQPAPQMYIVKPGDTLSKISTQFYGKASDSLRIFNANRDQLRDPDHINVGQKLIIPAA